MDAIGDGSQGARLMAFGWRDTRVLRVQRQARLTTPSGKILPLRLAGPAAVPPRAAAGKALEGLRGG